MTHVTSKKKYSTIINKLITNIKMSRLETNRELVFGIVQDNAVDFIMDGFIIDEDGYVNVFTDGACSSNGYKNARAGIGVWFQDNHPL